MNELNLRWPLDRSREAVSAVSFTAKQMATGGLSMVSACTVYAFACTLPRVVLLSSISRCCDAMHFLEYSQYLSSSLQFDAPVAMATLKKGSKCYDMDCVRSADTVGQSMICRMLQGRCAERSLRTTSLVSKPLEKSLVLR